MRFHRGEFYTAHIGGKLELQRGWIDSTNTYGFHKIQKKGVTTVLKWVCTDLNSGLRVCSATTRKACCEWVEKNQDRIAAQKSKEQYNDFVEEFQFRKYNEEVYG